MNRAHRLSDLPCLAAYTGKWDGTRFSDGKFSFTFKGSSDTGAWTGVSEMTPVVHTHMGMGTCTTSK
jgi:hypothetical protein